MLITEVRKLSQGSFGETILVERDGKRCVLKRLKQSAVAEYGQTAITLFQQESSYLLELGTHPQIPELIDSGTDANDPWILQQYIPGPTLEQLLVEQGNFSEDSITELLKSILPVLGFIHQHNAIHRDVKPANIIINEGIYYLVDFGASKRVSETVLAKTGTSIGTASYAAPEQVIGKAGYGSDIYSLGVTCIHLLTGMQPFELISMNEPGQWCWRDYLGAPVADGLARILNKMLEYSAARRYSSADQVLEDLRLIDKYEVEKRKARELRARQRNKAFVRWSKRVVGAAAGIGLIVGTVRVVPPMLHNLQTSTAQCEAASCHRDSTSDEKLSGPLSNTFNTITAMLPPEFKPMMGIFQIVTDLFLGVLVLGAAMRAFSAASKGEENPGSAILVFVFPLVMIVSFDAMVPTLVSGVDAAKIQQVMQNGQ